jgi:hypothetical protein
MSFGFGPTALRCLVPRGERRRSTRRSSGAGTTEIQLARPLCSPLLISRPSPPHSLWTVRRARGQRRKSRAATVLGYREKGPPSREALACGLVPNPSPACCSRERTMTRQRRPPYPAASPCSAAGQCSSDRCRIIAPLSWGQRSLSGPAALDRDLLRRQRGSAPNPEAGFGMAGGSREAVMTPRPVAELREGSRDASPLPRHGVSIVIVNGHPPVWVCPARAMGRRRRRPGGRRPCRP